MISHLLTLILPNPDPILTLTGLDPLIWVLLNFNSCLGGMSIEICDPTRLVVEAASFLALQVIQPYFSQISEYLDGLTKTLVRRIALISQDTS